MLTRPNRFIENTQSLSPNMYGFQAGLSTNDSHLRLHHDILGNPSKADDAALLALGLTKAFDGVTHAAILKGLECIGPGGTRVYNYVRAFLTQRTATLRLGDLTLADIRLPSYGTPQGSVILAFLFNLAVAHIQTTLDEIPELRYTLYADDIMLWVTQGSDALLEATLQAGAKAVEEGAALADLQCSPTNSELFVLPPRNLEHHKPPPSRYSWGAHPYHE